MGWLAVLTGMPKAVGTASCTVFFYLALPALVFAAFFTNFMDREELPKKYKLFLMMLPFLVAVLLFSYLPLYGWSYAFFNYKFGQPLSSHHKQVREYVSLLREMGYPAVEGWLWYVPAGEIVPA